MKFFISSTYIDLVEYRAYTIEYLKNLTDKKTGNFVAMEYFMASEDTSKDVCLSELEKSDIVIGIYGSRFGYVEEETGRSMTEIEFDRAIELGKPVLGFVTYNEQDERQKRFISEKVFAQGKNCGRFKSLQDFADVLHSSIKKYFKTIEGYSYGSIWDDISAMRQKIDEEIKHDSLHMEIYGDGNEREALSHITASANYLAEHLSLLYRMYNYCTGQPSSRKQNEELVAELRKKWDFFHIFLPNSLTRVRLATAYLYLSHLQHHLLTEVWTESLRQEVIKARDEYMEISKGSYYID